MASSSSLSCNFTISTSLDVGVSFQSADGGANYGGQITIFTPYTAGPITTGLWDNDGNVFFTIYNDADPSQSCTINSGSVPGGWTPYVVVANQSGLACTISPPQQTGENSYDYTLTVVPVGGEASAASADAAVAAPQQVATLILPAGGMQAWTRIMTGTVPVPDEINVGSPIVMAWTRFADGTQVAGGVYKYETPTDYNVKFMWVLDSQGNQYPGWPIDVSDDQDFLNTSYAFSPTGGEQATHLLNIVEEAAMEEPAAEAIAPVDYSFAIGLFDASQNPNELQLWQSGTLTIKSLSPQSEQGELTIPGYLSEPIPFDGPLSPPSGQQGTLVSASGQNSQAQVTLSMFYNYDGFLYNGSYIGGLISIYDREAEESYVYVIQGLCPQGPAGAKFRGFPGAADKRKR